MAILNEDQIESTHELYDDMIDKWRLWGTAYDGEDDFIKLALSKHPRESDPNFTVRKNEAEVFNYCATIVDLFNFFLHQNTINRDFSELEKKFGKLWGMFSDDVDLYSTDYEVFWNSGGKLSSVYGYVGILIDKANIQKPQGKKKPGKRTIADATRDGVYPYYALYTPENVLDWNWGKDPVSRRPVLLMVKLKDSDGSILVWDPTSWERWEKEGDDSKTWKLTETDTHSLGEVPFVWFTNYTNLRRPRLGISDVKGIARTQAAVTRDLSHGTEVIKYAAFPMLQAPMTGRKPEEEDDAVGVTAVLEFDPENPSAKHEWLAAEVSEPITAILSWIERKVDEIYRVAHLSAVHGQATSKEAQSGVSLRYEFQQLSAVLSAKAKSMDEAELKCLYYWLLWEDAVDLFEKIKVDRPNTFTIDDLSIQLENFLSGKMIVRSPTFNRVLQKKVARMILPEEGDKTLTIIDEEIDAQEDEDFTTDDDFGDNQGGDKSWTDDTDGDNE